MVDFGKLKTTKADRDLIGKIIARASGELPQFDRLELAMDLEAVHGCGNPMDFEALLAADKFNFAHDIFGISNHIDRKTGKLTDCFFPRMSRGTIRTAK